MPDVKGDILLFNWNKRWYSRSLLIVIARSKVSVQHRLKTGHLGWLKGCEFIRNMLFHWSNICVLEGNFHIERKCSKCI